MNAFQPVSLTSSQTENSITFYSQLADTAHTIGGSVLSKITEYIYPLIGTASTAAVAYWYSQSKNTLNRLVVECEQLRKERKYREIEKKVSLFINSKWPLSDIPSNCNTPENKKYLEIKIRNILMDSSETAQTKSLICTNVIDNFKKSLKEVSARINQDIKNDETFREIFQILPNNYAKQIKVLSNETHNKGKNVFSITLETGLKIIYKPRSMESEELICSLENSIFQEIYLPTYRIYNKKDQNYGYSQYLENNKKDNTFEDVDQLKEYYRDLTLIEQVAQEIRLTDLHSGNIIVSEKKPYLIDTEVVLSPNPHGEPFLTCLLEGTGSGCFEFIESNQVWLGQNLIKKISKKTKQI